MNIPTVKVAFKRNDGDPRGYKIINASDFDPSLDTLYGEDTAVVAVRREFVAPERELPPLRAEDRMDREEAAEITEQQMRDEIKVLTGRAPHWKAKRETVEAMHREALERSRNGD